MRLGKESIQRYHLKGFDYEICGQITEVGKAENKVFIFLKYLKRHSPAEFCKND